jgi:hypothetical protein
VGSSPTVSTSSSRLRSVNGKHAPFVRPRCGFDSCRRLLTLVAQWTERCSATAEDAGSIPAGRADRADVAQSEEHRVASPERPVRTGSSAFANSWCKRKHGELQPRRSGFESWRVCLEARVAGRSGSIIWEGVCCFGSLAAVQVRARPHATTATPRCCGPATLPLSTPDRQVAGSNPARSIRAPVAQWLEQFGRHTTTAAVPSTGRNEMVLG